MATIEISIAANANDGYASSSFDAGTNTLLIGNVAGAAYRSFFRFAGVTIPRGAAILSAKVSLRAYFGSGVTCNLKLGFESADNPTAPTSLSGLTSRTISSFVNWDAVATWSVLSWYDSPDLTANLQAIIDRAGWVSGNAVQVHILDNSSSSGAYRQPYAYENGASYAAKLTVEYEQQADVSDSTAANDAVDGYSLTEQISDAAGAGDAVEGYDFKGIVDDAVGAGDSVAAQAEFYPSAIDAAWVGDAVEGAGEIDAPLSDAAGAGDLADGFNWTSWLRANQDRSVLRYFCTLTGSNDGRTDIEIPISSFQARKRTGESNYLSVVVPGATYDSQIAERANGELIIEMAYFVGGVESLREEIIRVDLEQINPSDGPRSRTRTLIGHKTVTYDARAASLSGANYKYQSDGMLSFRFATADPYLNPGDSVTVEDTGDSFTVDYITYAIAARGLRFMEVREG